MSAAESAAPLLTASDISKRFAGVRALDRVRFEVVAGEVHALLGENGAGKSTLLKILAGVQAADEGSLTFAGHALARHDGPPQRSQAGLVTIHQELSLLPAMSVAENIFLGREPRRFGLIDWKRMRADARAAMAALGLEVDPKIAVEQLSVAQQQLVEIARALSQDARLIIMDEPTAALSGREVDTLHAIIRRLRADGVSVVYVTHRLEEVFAICNRFTVLRDGRFVAAGEVGAVTQRDIVRMMVGRDVEFERRARGSRRPRPPLFRATGVSRAARPGDTHRVRLQDLSITVAPGEIVGLAGLVGAGRTEFCRTLFGADRADSGRMVLGSGSGPLPPTPAAAIRDGIAMVPEDRKQTGCFLEQSVRQNLSLACLARISRWGLVDQRAEAQLVAHYVRTLNIKVARPDMPIGQLSGGNQQKVILARCMALAPRVLIVDEPTRGIDIGAKAEVHALLGRLAADGTAVIVISSELAEILAISDRIIVFREGQRVGEVDGDRAEEGELMAMMTGVAQVAEAAA